MNSRRSHSITSSARASSVGGHFKAEHPGSLGVDDEFEPRCLHDRQIGRGAALDDATDVEADLTISVRKIASEAHQTARQDKFAPAIGRGDRVAGRQIDQLGTPDLKEGVAPDIKRVRPFARERCKGGIDLAASAGIENLNLEPSGAARAWLHPLMWFRSSKWRLG